MGSGASKAQVKAHEVAGSVRPSIESGIDSIKHIAHDATEKAHNFVEAAKPRISAATHAAHDAYDAAKPRVAAGIAATKSAIHTTHEAIRPHASAAKHTILDAADRYGYTDADGAFGYILRAWKSSGSSHVIRKIAGPGKKEIAPKLLKAIQSGDMKGMKNLVRDGAGVNDFYPNEESDSGVYSLLAAAGLKYSSTSISIMKFLIDHGADPNLMNKITKKTPLLAAAKEGNMQAVTVLLMNDADMSHVDASGRSALMYSVMSRSLECCQVLMDAGSDASMEDSVGKHASALSMAESMDKNEKNAFISVLKGEKKHNKPESKSAPGATTRVRKLVGMSDFDKYVTGKQASLVSFCAPRCGYCKLLAPIYDQVAHKFAGNNDLVIATIDATDENNKDIATKYEVSMYPTIKFFPTDSSNAEDYDEERELDVFVKFIERKLSEPTRSSASRAPRTGPPSLVTTLVASDFDEHVNGKNYSLVAFISPWCGYCEKLVPEWELVAKYFAGSKDKMLIAKVDATDHINEELTIKNEIDHYPTIILFRGNSSKGEHYTYLAEKETLLQWLTMHEKLPQKFLAEVAKQNDLKTVPAAKQCDPKPALASRGDTTRNVVTHAKIPQDMHNLQPRAQHLSRLSVAAEPFKWIDRITWASSYKQDPIEITYSTDESKFPSTRWFGNNSEFSEGASRISFSADETLLYIQKRDQQFDENDSRSYPLVALDVETMEIKFTVPPSPIEEDALPPKETWQFLPSDMACDRCKNNIRKGWYICQDCYTCFCKECFDKNAKHPKGKPCSVQNMVAHLPPPPKPANRPHPFQYKSDFYFLGDDSEMILGQIDSETWESDPDFFKKCPNARGDLKKAGVSDTDIREFMNVQYVRTCNHKLNPERHKWTVFSAHTGDILWPETYRLCKVINCDRNTLDDNLYTNSDDNDRSFIVAPHVKGQPDIIAILPRGKLLESKHWARPKVINIYDITNDKILSRFTNGRGPILDCIDSTILETILHRRKIIEGELDFVGQYQSGVFSPNQKWLITTSLASDFDNNLKRAKEGCIIRTYLHLWPKNGTKCAGTLQFRKDYLGQVQQWLDNEHFCIADENSDLSVYSIIKDGKKGYTFHMVYKTDLVTAPSPLFGNATPFGTLNNVDGKEGKLMLFINRNGHRDESGTSLLSMWRSQKESITVEGNEEEHAVCRKVFEFNDAAKVFRIPKKEFGFPCVYELEMDFRASSAKVPKSLACISPSGKYVAMCGHRILIWKMHYGKDAETEKFADTFEGETDDNGMRFHLDQLHFRKV